MLMQQRHLHSLSSRVSGGVDKIKSTGVGMQQSGGLVQMKKSQKRTMERQASTRLGAGMQHMHGDMDEEESRSFVIIITCILLLILCVHCKF